MPPRRMAAGLGAIKAMPEDTVGQVEKKRAAFDAWKNDLGRWNTQVACDLYMAAFLLPKTEVPASHLRGMVPTTLEVRQKLAGDSVYGPLEAAGVDAARFSSVLHWPLEFPDVMVANGGFDVVLGNPPWEVVQLSEEEYFQSRAPEIADLKGVARKKAIAILEEERPQLFSDFSKAKRDFEAINEFSRAGHRFELTARGKLNTFGLFAELFLNLTRPKGRSGAILPTGIATDGNSSGFFGHIVAKKRIISLYSFENEEFIFPSVHHSFRFAILTIGEGTDSVEFSFFLRQTGALEDERRRFCLTSAEISRFNPNAQTAPVFRTAGDAKIASAIYGRVPILKANSETGKHTQGLEFRQGLFNKTVDSDLLIPNRFGPSIKSDSEYLPVLEGGNGFLFDHRYATFGNGELSKVEHGDKIKPNFEITTEYMMILSDYTDRLCRKKFERVGYWIAIRRVTLSSNERTVIASALPEWPATYGWLIAKQPRGPEAALLLCNLGAMVFKPTSPSSSRACWS
jgi:hypothetical protein